MHPRFHMRRSRFCSYLCLRKGLTFVAKKKAASPQWKAGMHPRTPKSTGHRQRFAACWFLTCPRAEQKVQHF